METEVSFPVTHQPATLAYPEPDESSLCPQSLLLYDPVQYFFILGLRSGLFLQVFLPKTVCAFLVSPVRATEPGPSQCNDQAPCWMVRASNPCRFQWLLGLRLRSAAVRLLGLWVRIPRGAWIFVLCLLYKDNCNART
jgi:hypothetical protein